MEKRQIEQGPTRGAGVVDAQHSGQLSAAAEVGARSSSPLPLSLTLASAVELEMAVPPFCRGGW